MYQKGINYLNYNSVSTVSSMGGIKAEEELAT